MRWLGWLIMLAMMLKLRAAEPLKAPLWVEGGRLQGKKKVEDTFEKDSPKTLKRKVALPTPGVWYLWLKLTSHTHKPSLLSYSLNDFRLPSARGEILVQPSTQSQWINYSRHPDFKIEVHAAEAGEHTLTLTLLQGDVTIEKIALTLFHSARLSGEEIDHSKDPGRGRLDFPVQRFVDGFREDWKSPPLRASGQTYYVDAKKGDDAHDGRSEEKAWRSLARVNAHTFAAGDAILLRRGQKWDEGLAPRGNGTAQDWITIGAFGKGKRPLINGVHKPGVSLTDQNYWVIRDLEVINNPEYKKSGIEILATKSSPQPKGIKIFNCVVYDTGQHGIHVGSPWGGKANGYDGVLIENCLVFATDGDGIVVGGNDQNGCRNTVIRHCTAYSNPGMAGIWIHSGQNGLIERCLAYNNACINIWTWNSINITIRECEAFRGRPQRDAGGFDIDWGCQAATMEYCYSHHNEGVGFLIMGSGTERKKYRGFPMSSSYNILRYCISEDDAEGISMLETFDYGRVYNNVAVGRGVTTTVFMVAGWPDLPKDGFNGGWPTGTEVFNNILVGRDGATPLWVDDHATRQGNVFDHNLFWRTDGQGPLIRWAGRKNGPKFWEGSDEGTFPPDDYSRLVDFRKATGQEQNGVHAEPLLRAAGLGGYGRLPLQAYLLLPKSPAIGAGKRVELSPQWLAARRKFLTETGAEAWGIPMEPAHAVRDYWGNKLRDILSIGAHEP